MDKQMEHKEKASVLLISIDALKPEFVFRKSVGGKCAKVAGEQRKRNRDDDAVEKPAPNVHELLHRLVVLR